MAITAQNSWRIAEGGLPPVEGAPVDVERVEALAFADCPALASVAVHYITEVDAHAFPDGCEVTRFDLGSIEGGFADYITSNGEFTIVFPPTDARFFYLRVGTPGERREGRTPLVE